MDNLNTLDNVSKNTHTKLFKLQFSGASGNNPTPLKTPDFKGFYSSRFAIDSNMTAKKSRCSAFYGRASFYAFSQFGIATKLLSLKSLINCSFVTP
ncbi:MAG: hypothetical protein E7568_03670 [Ruminococcaceae bacterium]|nr:hypothetical protein [Oscillospiraceae bacterium]